MFDASPDELELTMPGPRQPSVYEHALRESSIDELIASRPLASPCPHVLDKPGTIGSALQGGVGLLVAGVSGLAGSKSTTEGTRSDAGEGRNGTFSRLW